MTKPQAGSIQKVRLIRFKQVREQVPYSRMHIDRLEKAGQFPKRVQVGPNSVAWVESEIEEWIQAKAEARSIQNEEGDFVATGG